MSFLKSLVLASVPKNETNPTIRRRDELVRRLEEQKSLLADSNYVRVSTRFEKRDGKRTAVEKTTKVRPWWRSDERGRLVFFVKVGSKMIEFERGKSGIVSESKDQLPKIIDTLISATKSGELDPLIGRTERSKEKPKPTSGTLKLPQAAARS